MAEGLAVDDPLCRIVVIGKSIEHSQERGVLNVRSGCGAHLLRKLARAGHTIRTVRMGARPGRHRIGLPSLDPGGERLVIVQLAKHRRHAIGVIARSGGVADTQAVRLILLRAAEPEGVELCPGACDASQDVAAGEPAYSRRQKPAQGSSRVALVGMPRGDVPDFVAEHRCELRLAVHQGEQLAGDIDIAAGDRERVLDRRIEQGHREVTLRVREPGLNGHALADSFDERRLGPRIGAAELRQQLGMGLRTLSLVGSGDGAGCLCRGRKRRRHDQGGSDRRGNVGTGHGVSGVESARSPRRFPHRPLTRTDRLAVPSAGETGRSSAAHARVPVRSGGSRCGTGSASTRPRGPSPACA